VYDLLSLFFCLVVIHVQSLSSRNEFFFYPCGSPLEALVPVSVFGGGLASFLHVVVWSAFSQQSVGGWPVSGEAIQFTLAFLFAFASFLKPVSCCCPGNKSRIVALPV